MAYGKNLQRRASAPRRRPGKETFMLTIQQIHAAVNREKPVSRRQLFRYFDRLHIRPLGMRTIPRMYADDAPSRIIAALGVPTMAQLRDLRRRSQAARSRAGKGAA